MINLYNTSWLLCRSEQSGQDRIPWSVVIHEVITFGMGTIVSSFATTPRLYQITDSGKIWIEGSWNGSITLANDRQMVWEQGNIRQFWLRIPEMSLTINANFLAGLLQNWIWRIELGKSHALFLAFTDHLHERGNGSRVCLSLENGSAPILQGYRPISYWQPMMMEGYTFLAIKLMNGGGTLIILPEKIEQNFLGGFAFMRGECYDLKMHRLGGD
jgi:hypothetical protein